MVNVSFVNVSAIFVIIIIIKTFENIIKGSGTGGYKYMNWIHLIL